MGEVTSGARGEPVNICAIMQGRGIGHALIEFCVARIRARGGDLLWRKGRTSACAFYESLGFRATGEEFDVPISGLHFIFRLEL